MKRSKGNTVTNDILVLCINIQDSLLAVDMESLLSNPVILWALSIYLAHIL